MNEQLKIMLQGQLTTLRNERAASNADFDAKISDVQKQLGIEPENNKKPSPAQEFQAERDNKPSPFSGK